MTAVARRGLAAALVALGIVMALTNPAPAQGKARPKPVEAPKDKAPKRSEKPAETSDKPAKTKELNFSGLDIEGKLKTPQLLYFLNRVRVELDSSTPGKRSFMKELERSADAKGL